jgi:hypothetical protein
MTVATRPDDATAIASAPSAATAAGEALVRTHPDTQ